MMKFLLYSCLVTGFLFGCQENNIPEIIDPLPVKDTSNMVLFIGNSYTYYNDGVDYHLEQLVLADTTVDSVSYVIKSVTKGAYRLEYHWNDNVSTSMITSQNWDYVVLQEHSTRPFVEYELFELYATKLDSLIREMDSQTALFMTWPLKDEPWNITLLDNAYSKVDEKLDALLAPVGRAWEYVKTTHPEINLYSSDDKHPSLSGTYLTSCIFEIVLFGMDPRDSDYVPYGMTFITAAKLRTAAFDYMISLEA
ncbi:MAG: hypothetical protein P1P82_12820 [Bacteroidales bacterium]|nr:hypothetical protein [Bacteroidales bacterium]MDT8432387.1 hypothetical protein [Bacteroidales bacterium]